MTVGKATRAVGVSTKAIRVSEAKGLTLSEIRDIMDLQHAGATPCRRISQLIDRRITQRDHALAELQQLCHKLIITPMIALACDRDGDRIDLIVCPIIQSGTLEC